MALKNVKKAVRENIWVKVALMAPSGGGKTYSSLRLATGMKNKLAEMGEKCEILMLNTEAKRGYYYADEFEYSIIDVPSPHTPEKYVDLIKEIEKDDTNYILIMDSSSHEWEGTGGCLEIAQNLGGSFQAWGKVTPRHNKFIEAIADSEIHIIATMRGKDQYVMETNDQGKSTVKKLGVGSKQREGFEYEFTVTFLLDQKTNMAESQKDNTHIFENDGFSLLSESHGSRLIEWANSGDAEYVPIKRHEKTLAEQIKESQGVIIDLAKELGGSSNVELMDVIKKYESSGNTNRINDLPTLEGLIEELQLMKIKKEQDEENK